MSSTVITALATALQRDPGRPFVTFYDGATGERIELSVKTFDNWVNKVANLLSDELMLEAGDAVTIDLPPHWQSTVLAMGAWAAGLCLAESPIGSGLRVVGPDALADVPSIDTPVLAVSLRPLGGPFVEPLPVGWLDFGREVPPQPDALLVEAGLSADDIAVVRGEGSLTHLELFAAGAAAAESIGLPKGGRLITDANPADLGQLIEALVAPLAVEGSVVLVVNVPPAGRADIARQETADDVSLGGWMSGVEAVIVAGGLGTRLLPLTERRPKHLLPVGGIPFVTHQLAKLGASGVRRIVLATSYYAEMFEPTLGDGSAWGVELVYVREEVPLGTAGAIRHSVEFLESAADEPIVILNGDILSSHDLSAQLAHHRDSAADVTLHLVKVPDARDYGCVPTDSHGRVTAFLEKSPDPVSRQINAGCYVFTRRMIDEIPAGRVVSVERETFPALVDAGRRVNGWLDECYWLDVGTPAALTRASADVVRGIATSAAVNRPVGEAWISPNAAMTGRAVARGGSAIGSGAWLDDGAVVEASIVDEGASIGAGSTVVESVVGAGAVIGDDVILRHAVIGDGASIGAGCELLHGMRVAADAMVMPGAMRFS